MAESEISAELAKVQEVKEVNEGVFLQKANVVGVGIGYKETKGKEKTADGPCIQVYVEKKMEVSDLAADDLVPETVDSVKTDVREVGIIEAQPYTDRIRPARPGYSIGHFRITAGTFGCLVRDVCPPCKIHILSNNHVLANSNAASVGDPILQPGAHDGGVIPGDVIARLSRFVPIRYNDPNNYNLVDAALASPRDLRDVIASVVALGIPKGIAEATLNLDVVKSGRTTQTTAGRVTGIQATVAVNYGVGVGYFRDQILTTNMSAGGDSGSLLMTRAERKATGLLFAGSSQVTVHNNITNVLMALGVELITA
jgi:hypothetical protein